MILPIVAYGNSVLKKRAEEVNFSENNDLNLLVENLFETMYNAQGVGLAAPQIGVSSRVFVVDASPMLEEENKKKKENPVVFKEVFINPIIKEESGDLWSFEEGCLSIPEVNISVNRREIVHIKYQNLDGDWKELALDGIKGRIVQHEYDHIEGVLFTDYATSIKKRLLRKKLEKIAQGNIETKYPMKFPSKKSK